MTIVTSKSSNRGPISFLNMILVSNVASVELFFRNRRCGRVTSKYGKQTSALSDLTLLEVVSLSSYEAREPGLCLVPFLERRCPVVCG
jgi:hypothetical protein